jgi:hypothetical protein
MSKQNLTRIIYNQVDLILFEEGNFSPLNWLLREGHLNYSDYQHWKKGQIEYLENHFKTSSKEIISALEKVREYASLHKLESFKQKYISATGELLHFSRSPKHELIFTNSYEPAHDRVQMDLFFDSADACAVSGLITAIINKSVDEIPNLMTRLESSNPEKQQQFTQLMALEKKITHSGESSDKKIKILLQELTPLTFEILVRFSHDFLTPLWHKISEEIEHQSFDTKAPDYHLSFTAFKGYQWQQVITSIERETDWIRQPVLIFRYAEACFKLNKEREGIVNWFNLFILFPETAKQFIKDTCNHILLTDYQRFFELDPELESSLFPAWMVMNKPALVKNNVLSEIKENESVNPK